MSKSMNYSDSDVDNNQEMDTPLFDDDEDKGLDPQIISEKGLVYPMNEIPTEKGYYSVYELKRKHDRTPSLLILDSEFQRDAVWGKQQKSELIESLIMGLPLPIFYFNEDKQGRLIVVDGRQRLTALFQYINNEFKLGELKILKDLSKKSFTELDPLYQSRIEDYQIIAHIIKPSTPDRVKFDIFDRVNRGGTKLNNQEIRNALYQGKATKLLSSIVKTEEFKLATDKAFDNDKRMKNRYLVLRFISFYFYYNNKLIDAKGNKMQFSNDIDASLGRTMELINDMPDKEVDSLLKVIVEALKKARFYNNDNVFRLVSEKENGKIHRYPININIFESIMLMMTYLPDNDVQNRYMVNNMISKMKYSNEYRETLDKNRDSNARVNKRIEIIRKTLESIKGKMVI